MRLLFVQSPIGPFARNADGVDLRVGTLAGGLVARGHTVDMVAPAGSEFTVGTLHEVQGSVQPSQLVTNRTDPVAMSADGVLPRMWHRVAELAHTYDVIINSAYDWLPFYLSSFLPVPLLHILCLASRIDFMDFEICRCLDSRPGTVAALSHAQAASYACADRLTILGCGIDLAQYHLQQSAADRLAWVGRISPEKGLEHAIGAAAAVDLPLHVFGRIQDEAYWRDCLERAHAGGVTLDYRGFLPTAQLQRELGKCRALLMTTTCIEAFGQAVIEALACGVPVVTFDDGGPAETIDHGKTGFIVARDQGADGLARALRRIAEIDRRACRRAVQQRYSLEAHVDNFIAWIDRQLA